jgi:putative sigma-54 modulation protein
MKVEIKTRHFHLDDETRERIEAQCEKLERFSPRPISEVRLQIVFEQNLFACDGLLLLRGHEFRAENAGAEPDQAVQGVVENLQRQLDKFKGKVSGKQRGEPGGLGRALAVETPSEHLPTEHFELREMDDRAARAAFTASDAPFLVFRNAATGRLGVIYRRNDGDLGLMEATGD